MREHQYPYPAEGRIFHDRVVNFFWLDGVEYEVHRVTSCNPKFQSAQVEIIVSKPDYRGTVTLLSSDHKIKLKISDQLLTSLVMVLDSGVSNTEQSDVFNHDWRTTKNQNNKLYTAIKDQLALNKDINFPSIALKGGRVPCDINASALPIIFTKLGLATYVPDEAELHLATSLAEELFANIQLTSDETQDTF